MAFYKKRTQQNGRHLQLKCQFILGPLSSRYKGKSFKKTRGWGIMAEHYEAIKSYKIYTEDDVEKLSKVFPLHVLIISIFLTPNS